ncbi:MAG: 2-dehydropantoate 2-reductase [Candidatus Omnitrophica bacterium]|nr:2-dehydropantoate 2-reductase [Candidatus Omnitrophota bacterium]
MKITIVGAGAMGSLLAAFLSKSKEEIWILHKDEETAAKISQNGISIEGVSGNWQAKPKITIHPQDIGNADLVIICVKSYDTKAAILKAKPIIGENTRILTLQNGIGNIEIISEVAGQDKVIGGVTNEGATFLEPGRIRHAGRGETIIGRNDGRIPVEMRSIRELFNRVGLETKISRDIKSILWSKLIINAGINALTAITRLPNGKLLEFEGTRKIMREAVSEAVRVAKRKRIKLIYDDPLGKVEAVCEATSANISSMLQDVLRRKRTEIEYINGAIVRQAQELNVSAPVNSFLADLVKTIETTYELTV